MLILKNLSLMRGAKLLFQNVNLAFYAGQKIGVVGRNGSGKTSLFALILGFLEANEGEVSFASSLNFAYVEQEIPDLKRRALDYVIDADKKLRELEAELSAAETNADGAKIAEIYTQISDIDGFTAEARAAKLLDGLGLSQEQMQANVNELSGGLRVRLNLARALMQRADVMLLDEPTNHLDLDAVVWLENWLQKYSGLLLLISHDREFLDNVVSHVAHLDNASIKLYSGNYTQFETAAAEQAELQQKQYEKQQKHREHLQSYVDRFRYKATKARQAQSRIKALERMQKLAPVYAKLPFTFKFISPDKMPHFLLHLEHVDFAYEPLKPVLENVEFNVEAAMRAALLGRNGAGKSTLIKILAGELKPAHGVLEIHPHLRVGYFAQYALDKLDLDLSALGNFKKFDTSFATEGKLRGFLGSFAFAGDMALQKVGTLSGGEKARLCLAMLVWQKPNLLLLDEPTNHLDMDMREALLLALQDFVGAVVLVSHDRYLVNSAVDDLYLVHDKKVSKYEGDLMDYQKWLLQHEYADHKETVIEKPQVRNTEQPPTKRLKSIERNLDKIKQQLDAIDFKLADAAFYQNNEQGVINQLASERANLADKIANLEEEWLRSQEAITK